MQHDQRRGAAPAGRARLLAVAVAAAVAIAGCASGAEREISPVIMRPPSTFAGSQSIDAQLQAALEATGRGYRFETTVTVGDAVTEHIAGVVSGSAWYTTTVTGGATVEYLRTDDGQWVRSIAELWIPADLAIEEPVLEVFGTVTPSGISGWDASENGWIELHARYPGASVGMPNVAEVDVDVTIGDGVVREVRYVVPTGDDTTEVVTVISDVGDVGPIESPRARDRNSPAPANEAAPAERVSRPAR